MAKGRKPNQQTVVPMCEPGQAGGCNMEERTQARVNELKPEGLSDDVLWTYNRLAPPLCHPTVNRLSAVNIFMFMQLCRVVARHERLIVELEELGETYASETKNGVQYKSRPEVGQLNETFRQIRALAGEFGMTPSTERSVMAPGQMGFNFPGREEEDYLT